MNDPEECTGYVLIPPHILCRKDLSMTQKVLLGKIIGLTRNNGYCYASNEWLAKELGLTAIGVRTAISKFVTLHLLEREVVRNDKKQVVERKLTPWGGIHPPMGRGYDMAVAEGYDMAVAEVYINNKDINTKSINTEKTLSTEQPPGKQKTPITTNSIPKSSSPYGNTAVSEVISYLKEKTGLTVLDDTDKTNRRYAWLLLKKWKDIGKIKDMINAAIQDAFWKTKVTSVRTLFYKGVRILETAPPKPKPIICVKFVNGEKIYYSDEKQPDGTYKEIRYATNKG